MKFTNTDRVKIYDWTVYSNVAQVADSMATGSLIRHILDQINSIKYKIL
jgi:hypothetical protein